MSIDPIILFVDTRGAYTFPAYVIHVLHITKTKTEKFQLSVYARGIVSVTCNLTYVYFLICAYSYIL